MGLQQLQIETPIAIKLGRVFTNLVHSAYADSGALISVTGPSHRDVEYNHDTKGLITSTSISGLKAADFQIGLLPTSLPETSEMAATYVELVWQLRKAPRGSVSLEESMFLLSQITATWKAKSFLRPGGWKGEQYQLDARLLLFEMIMREIVLHTLAEYGLLEQDNDSFMQALADNRINDYLKQRLETLSRIPVPNTDIPIPHFRKAPSNTFDQWLLFFSHRIDEISNELGISDSHRMECARLNANFFNLLLIGIPSPNLYQNYLGGVLSYQYIRWKNGRMPSNHIGRNLERNYPIDFIRRKIATNDDSNMLQHLAWEALNAFKLGDIFQVLEGFGFGPQLSGVYINSGASLGIGVEEALLHCRRIKVIHVDKSSQVEARYRVLTGGRQEYLVEDVANATRQVKNILGERLANGIVLIHPDSPSLIERTLKLAKEVLAPGGLIIAVIDRKDERVVSGLGFVELPYVEANCWIYQRPFEGIVA